ncbi:hypothetical protein DRO38_06915, partial [Candidatus Bathyarchaeota archaeon]
LEELPGDFLDVPENSIRSVEMKLLENILRFENHFKNAKKLNKKDISDYLVYNTLAMECFQTVNAIIEIGEYIVTKKRLGFPSTYREIFELLHQNQMMAEEVFNATKRLIFLS